MSEKEEKTVEFMSFRSLHTMAILADIRSVQRLV